jgi:hypothetical protein
MPTQRCTSWLALIFFPLACGLAWSQEAPDPELRDALRAAVNMADSFDDRFDAEVWLSDMSRRLARQVPDPDERMRILTRVHFEASIAGIEPELVLAVIEVESNFDSYSSTSSSRTTPAHTG